MRWKMWLPLALLAFFLGLAAYQLGQPRNDVVASTMIGRPLPKFTLPAATGDRPGVSLADFQDGKPRLMNIWASWCLPCIAEAPQLEKLRESGAEIVGIAIKDKPEDVSRFLASHGNPYARIGVDDFSAIQLEIGSSGVPETFVIDGKGVIRYQHIGDIRPEHVSMLLAELEKAS